MSILYRGPSKDASYQVFIHLAKLFHRRGFFRNQPIFEIRLSNLPARKLQNYNIYIDSIETIWQVTGPNQFSMTATNQKQEWPVAAMFVNGSGQNEQSL